MAPWSSGNSPVGADWFEVTNASAVDISISGWKMDDNSGSFAASVTLNGITTIKAGESVIFIETNSQATVDSFKGNWFGGNAPASLQVGTYTGSGVGLGTGGDAVNLYDAAGTLKASIAFGASPTGPYKTFDNAAGLNGVGITLSQLSAEGRNAAFSVAHSGNASLTEVGSPGEIAVVNDAPMAVDDTLSAVAEDSGARTISAATRTGNDKAGPSTETAQTLTITAVGNAVGGNVALSGGNVVFTPAANFNGTASFDYTVQDNGTSYGLSDPKTDLGSVSFSVTAVNDAPAFTSGAAFSAAENQTVVGTVAASDIEGNAISFAISGGADQTFFAIDASTGALAFIAAPDFETAEDANANGAYEVTVQATDGHGGISTQAVVVTVTDTAEAGLVLNATRLADNLIGGTGADTASGANGDDSITGGDGNDQLAGGNNNDTLAGGRGNDQLSGDAGHDMISGGLGGDTISGGLNNDTVAGDAGNDQLMGDAGNDSLDGGAGADTVDGGDGNDSMAGGAGADTMDGGNGNDSLAGEAGDDLLTGGVGRDTIEGGDGNDLISGGLNVDVLIGGAGADVFVLGNTAADRDAISDFVSGVDLLEISVGLFGGGLVAGGDASGHFLSAKKATAATATFLYDQASGRLSFDADGTGSNSGAVFIGTFDNHEVLRASDFHLIA